MSAHAEDGRPGRVVYGTALAMSQPPPPDETPFARFAALVRRELGAEDVRIMEPAAQTGEAPNVLYTTLPDGARLAVTFAEEPDNREALARRLEILVGTFAQTANDELPARTRFTVARSLHDELRALSVRAQAVDALVLDAHSPVVWGSATRRAPLEELDDDEEGTDLRLVGKVEGAVTFLDTVRGGDGAMVSGPAPASPTTPSPAPVHVVSPAPPLVAVPSLPSEPASEPGGDRDRDGDGDGDPPSEPGEPAAPVLAAVPPPPALSAHGLRDQSLDELGESSHRAIREVRAREEMPDLRKGKQLHHHHRAEEFGYVAHSFAGIYVLVLVFEAEYDEIRAERAIQESLPRIERLVLALPPLDPTPEPRANVVSLRRARRR